MSTVAMESRRSRNPEPRGVPRIDASDSTVSLWPLAVGGDPLAVEILMARMRPYLKRFGHNKLPRWARTRAETEDLVQESLIRALRHMPEFQGQTVRDFRNWLLTVFRNLVIDETRYHYRKGFGEELPENVPDERMSPEEQAVERQRTDVFDAALGCLRPDERLLVIYRLQHGYSFQDVADRLDKPSPDAARMTYSRALAKLRVEVGRLTAR